MSRVCPVLLKKPLSGHNVSHANNKTLRRFLPNLHQATFYSPLLNRDVRLRLSAKGIKTIEKYGGIDGFLKITPKRRLHGPLLLLSKELAQKSL